MNIKYIQQPYHIQTRLTTNVSNDKQSVKQSFQNILESEEAKQLKVSKHASNRLQERNIAIDDKQWEKITNKVFEAKSKGVNDSLVLTNNAALIVSAKNATVITAMNRQEAQDQLFTNIDGTIVLE